MQKKINKLIRDPKLFFKDAVKNKTKIFTKFKMKKYNANSKYLVITAVYNAEKYLEQYFCTIFRQRLYFKRNIFLVLIDDGSTDNSADVIKKYQKKYPNNITYLYKENGGQASARNFGLNYIKEKDLKVDWISFIDADDFLDVEFFYQIDKFLSNNKNSNLSILSCNVVEYNENKKKYFNVKCLDYISEWERNKIFQISDIPSNFYLSFCNATLFRYDKIRNISFDEECKPHFEDGKFIAEFLFSLQENDASIAFLSNAIYYYRKRLEKNSTVDRLLQDINSFIKVPRLGWLDVLMKASSRYGMVPMWIQNTIFWDIYWRVEAMVSKSDEIVVLSPEEEYETLWLMRECLKYIDIDFILSRRFLGFYWKIGILHSFKNEKIPFRIVFFHKYDQIFHEFVISYYTYSLDEDCKILFDGIQGIYEEICKVHKIFEQDFIYEKILRIKVPLSGRKFEMFLDGKRANIEWNGIYYRQFFYTQRFLNK
ncbi:glycosyltransferase family 2 protein [Campylobacter lari]|uniref:glycosyltransferase family 2 protein n=1 Tax=Campylobacter lari TaxID=201 RepID=UPI00372D6B64